MSFESYIHTGNIVRLIKLFTTNDRDERIAANEKGATITHKNEE